MSEWQGKQSWQRPEGAKGAFVEGYAAIDWNARERDGVQGVHEGKGQDSRAHGPSHLQPITGQDVPTGT